ncbi:MAG TPA: thiamine pyrophosphate-dependent dehydrogenase E1 component subunit alpha [Burkholderiales bacterium]|nr:thiamine pyrophosphate-dependent dehydrogenase E1 component subunit alpha [Burkholderiales bacterium]
MSEGLRLYGWMALSRALDEVLCAANPRWFPSAGEEATMVGAFCDLRADDAIAAHYRDPLVIYMMRGAEMARLAAQVLGKVGGYNKGRSVPFTGPVDLHIVPWVAGDLGTSLGIATGAALAFQQEGSDRICVCSFGDGTANRGDFHENLNLAASWRLPIVYVCQHNGWAISQPASDYLPAPVAHRAAGYGMPGVEVDGNDLDAVRRVTTEAIKRAREGKGPSLIEARTWRAKGHWAADPQDYRGIHADMPMADPLVRYGDQLIQRGEASASDLERLCDAARATVMSMLATVKALPDTGEAELGLDEIHP